MTPYTAALDHCIGLLGQCRQAEVSLLISNEQMVRMKTRSVNNRVRYNLTHQLADLIVKDIAANRGVVISQEPANDDTQFTLQTVVMKEATYLDLMQGLNVLRTALDLDGDEPEVDDRQYEMFP